MYTQKVAEMLTWASVHTSNSQRSLQLLSASTFLISSFPSYTPPLLYHLIHKLLHPLQPPNILLLLLDINEIRHEIRQRRINAPHIKVLLEQALDLLVELVEGRAGVEVVRDVGGGGGGVHDLVDGEAAGVGDEVDAQAALVAGAGDEDVDVGGEGLLGVVVVL